jgi:hypothetical protein
MGFWQTLLKQKYVGSKALSPVIWKLCDSHFWTGLMETKKNFFRHGFFFLRMDLMICFCEDKWLGNTTNREQPYLYAIVRHKGDSLAHVLESNPPNMTFIRTLFGPRLISWEALLQRLANIQLTYRKDEFR